MLTLVIDVSRSFHNPTPAFLINLLAIVDLVSGIRNFVAALVRCVCISWLVIKKVENMSGRREFLNLNIKVAAVSRNISGSRNTDLVLQ